MVRQGAGVARMSIEAGGAFRCLDGELTGDTAHMWVILSDPVANPESVVIVNLSSSSNLKSYDPACDLKPADHWFISHPTFVFYHHAVVRTAEELRSGNIQPLTSLRPPVLVRIRHGAGESRRLPRGIRKLLIEQGIVPGSTTGPDRQ